MNEMDFKTEMLTIQDELLRFADKLTNEHEDAKKLLEKTKKRAIECKEEFKPDMNFRGWIYTLMRNIFITDYRKEVRSLFSENLNSINQFRDIALKSTGAAYDLEEIHLAINRLPKEYRIPFSMHISGFKDREIAEKLGITYGAVRYRISFCRKQVQIGLRQGIQ